MVIILFKETLTLSFLIFGMFLVVTHYLKSKQASQIVPTSGTLLVLIPNYIVCNFPLFLICSETENEKETPYVQHQALSPKVLPLMKVMGLKSE